MVLLYPRFASTFRYYVKRATGAFTQTKNAALEFNVSFADPVLSFNPVFTDPKGTFYHTSFIDPVEAFDTHWSKEAATLP